MFLVVRTPRKTVGPVSGKIVGHNRKTGEAEIVIDVVSFRYFGCF